MADIRCPTCGKDNPDFLDVCQFCQTPLKPESMVHIGEKPTKKNTGELEPILPQWLQDVRQQSRDSADEEAAQAATLPKIPKNEAPDLLAGLVSQVGSDEEDVPDWLASINPPTQPKAAANSTPIPETDFFAQFNKSESMTAAQPVGEPADEEVPSWIAGAASQSPTAAEKDELSEWLSKASTEADAPVPEVDTSQDDMGWPANVASPEPALKESNVPKEEDLGWLHDLEASSKQSAEPSRPQRETDWGPGAEAEKPASRQEDLSWLNMLGGRSESPQPTSTPAAPEQDDLNRLNNPGGLAGPSEMAPERGPSSGENLDWLDNLGAAAQSSVQEPPSSQPADLDWLNTLGGQSVSPFAEPPVDQTPRKDEMGWPGKTNEPQDSASSLPSVAPFMPRRTAPLSDANPDNSMPDWLKSATEESPMLPLGADALDQFRDDTPISAAPDTPFSWKRSLQEISGEEETPATAGQAQPFDQTEGMPAPAESNVFSTPGDSSSLSSQDVDSLFSVEMPDWLSRSDPGVSDPSSKQQGVSSAEGLDSLSPVDLPSWVQAMRPVESVISDAAGPSIDNQPTEKEGPLAGLRGVIPAAPIGSSMRPKALSLKLQATEEQQTSASLLEQILAGETNPRPIAASSLVTSQSGLRWMLTGLFWIVLGAVIAMRTQLMPISAALPVEVDAASSSIASIPDNASVLLVIDYEPSLAGEMEAVGGPLLNHMVLSHHPQLNFLSTSPNGSALVERLMTNTMLNRPAPDGPDYTAGEEYFNLGYLPGGSAGVLGFVQSPVRAMPAANVEHLSAYAAVIVLTDHAESGRVWVEQLDAMKKNDPALVNQPLLVVASAQAGPLLQPYVSSRQIAGMISGLSDAARYEYKNNVPPGIARTYWDAFGVGLVMAIGMIALGSLWSLVTGIRSRRANAERG